MSNLEKQGLDQAVATLKGRIGMCEGAVTLRTKSCRTMSEEALSKHILYLKDYWAHFSFDIRGKLCDASSEQLQRALAKQGLKSELLMDRQKTMEGSRKTKVHISHECKF